MIRPAIALAVIAAMVAGGFFYAFVRPVPEQTATGVITARTFAAAETRSRTTPTVRGPSVAERRVELPDRYQFTIRLDGEPMSVRYGIEAHAAEPFAVGQRVTVRYQRRGLRPLWERVYVSTMEPAGVP
jgi:hypothetical protein